MMIVKAPESQQWDSRVKRAFSAWMSASTRKKAVSVGLTAFALITVPVTLIALQQQIDLRSRASSSDGTIVINPGRWLRTGPIITGSDNEVDTPFIQFAKASTLNLPLRKTSSQPPTNAVYVDNSYTGSISDGSIGAPFKSIDAAVKEVQNNRTDLTAPTIVIRKGTYHESVIINKKPIILQAYPDEEVWFDGSRVLSDFVLDTSITDRKVWKKTEATVFRTETGELSGDTVGEPFQDPAYSMSPYPEMVFYNGTPLLQVSTLSNVRPGSFFVDSENDTLYIGDDPSGADIEEANLFRAVLIRSTSAAGSKIDGIGFRKYGSTHPDGMVNVQVTNNVTVANSTFAWAGGTGLDVDNCDTCTLINNIAVFNAFSGFGSNKSTLIFAQNYMAFNNFERTMPWGVAGAKFHGQINTVLRDNTAEYNLGFGLWCDISCYDTNFINNVGMYNAQTGIFYEISRKGIIASNLLVGNHTGVRVSGTSDVKLYNNTIVRNVKGIWLTDDNRVNTDPVTSAAPYNILWKLENISIINNIISESAATSAARLVEAGELGGQELEAEVMVKESDYNAYYRTQANQPEIAFQYGSRGRGLPVKYYKTLTELQNGVQKDTHSIMPNPTSDHPYFGAGGWNYLLNPTSIALQKGTNLPSDVASSFQPSMPTINTTMGILNIPQKLVTTHNLDSVRKTTAMQPNVTEYDASFTVLRPLSDTYIDKSNSDMSFGSADKMLINGNPDTQKIALMKFDLSSLAGKKIISAQVRSSSSMTSKVPHSIRLAGDKWGDGATYNSVAGIVKIDDVKIAVRNGGVEKQLVAYDVTSALTSAIEAQKNVISLAMVAEESTSSADYGIYPSDTTVKPSPLKLTLRVSYADATSCPYLPNYLGIATTQIQVTNDGVYRLWSNIRSNGNNGNSFWIKVDRDGTDTCNGNVYRIGDSPNMQHDTWQWVDNKNGDQNQRVSVPLTAGKYTLTLYGREPGLQLGRVIFTQEYSGATCTPTGNGDNCVTVIPPTSTPTVPKATNTPTPTHTPTPTPTPIVASNSIERVVTGRVFIESSAPYGIFDPRRDLVRANAQIAISGPESKTVTTNSEGIYRFVITKPGSYSIKYTNVPSEYYVTNVNPVTKSITESSLSNPVVQNFILRRSVVNR